jgi:hypothetical protein
LRSWKGALKRIGFLFGIQSWEKKNGCVFKNI